MAHLIMSLMIDATVNNDFDAFQGVLPEESS